MGKEKLDKTKNECEIDDSIKHYQVDIKAATLGIDKNYGTISGLTGSLSTKGIESLNGIVISGNKYNESIYSSAKMEPIAINQHSYKIDPISIDTKMTFKVADNYSAFQGINSISNLHIKDGTVELANSAFMGSKYEAVGNYKSILGDSHIVNGAFTLDTSSVISSSKLNTNLISNDVWYVKNGSLVESPTQRLVSGAIDHLGLTSNNRLSFDTSIIVKSSVSPAIMGITQTTQTILSGIEWNKIGTSYNFDMLGQIKIKDSFLEVSSKYLDLYTPAKGSVAAFSIPNPLNELTSLEYLNNSFLLRSTYEPETVKEKLLDKLETNEVLLRHLSWLKPDLKNIYIGALEALHSKNSDRVRHYTTSLRELFTHVLHLLAPDNQIKEWTNDKNHYSNGRPTRKARILYISRKFNNDKFEKFVNTDVNATIEFIDLFQEGTHSIKSSYSESQLAIMKTKMEDTLVYLIEASKID